jgi:glutamate carboxypeptidase
MSATDRSGPFSTSAHSVLRELCAISSESGNTEGIRLLAVRLASLLEPYGLETSIEEERDAGGLAQPTLIARGKAAGDGHLLLVGHLDTVLPAIEPRIEGRRLFAAGALDMKGGLAMLLGALELLAARGVAPPADLVLVAVPDEESAGEISTRAMNRWSRDARAVLVLEPGMIRGGRETLVAGRRGLTEWTLEVKGRGAHSGLAYWEGRSALTAAAAWCTAAHQLSRRGEGPTVNVGRLVAGTADFVDDLGARHDMLRSVRQLNVVPDRAFAAGEVRFLASRDGREVLGELAALADRIAADSEVAMTFGTGATIAPFDPHGPGASLLQRAIAIGAARGFELDVETDRGGISFPNFLSDPGRTPVIDGLGPVGDGMHVRGEYLDLDSLERRVVLLADLLESLK